MAFRVLGDRVMIEVDEAPTTEGGIFLPQSAQSKPQRGTVVAVGQGKRLENGSFAAAEVKEGDKVVFAKYGGTEVRVDGKEYMILSSDQIYGIVKD